MTGDITTLFQSHVRNLKRSGSNGQYTGLCPLHRDKHPSFSVNLETGCWKCHAGCGGGDAADFAERLALDPKPYYRGGNGSPPPATTQPKKGIPLPESEIEKARAWYSHLITDFDSLAKGLPWTQEGVKKAGVGYDPDTSRFVYIHRDSQGQVVNIKHGKGKDGQAPYNVKGHGQTRLYPAHLIKDYEPGFVIYCEGEPDVVTLLSHGFQAVTGTAGAGSVPPDLRPLSKFKLVVILLDHDKAGKAGSVKTADAIMNQCLDTKVYISYWPEGKPVGYDVTDFFQDGGTAEEFDEQMLKGLPLYERVEKAAPGQSTFNVREPITVRLSDIEPEVVKWLWEPYIPLGKLTLLEGDPGIGKTWLALQLAASISKGNPFPGFDGIPAGDREPGGVLYLSAEDGLADTLRPRLDAAGADPSRIHALTGWRQDTENGETSGQVSLQDIPTIETAVAMYQPTVIVIDPLQAYFGAGVDYHRANETRPILAALGQMAERHDIAVLCIRHLGKSRQDRAIYKGLGSIDFAAAARSILLVGQSPDDPTLRVMAHVKSSLAPLGPSMAYQLRDGDFLWAGVSEITADALLAPQSSEETKSAIAESRDYLKEALRFGPVASTDLIKECKEIGISEKTLRRAKEDLGVVAYRSGDPNAGRGAGQWLWKLPEAPK